MNWYKEVVVCEALGLEYDKVLNKYSVDRLQSVTELLNPKVLKYANIVVERETNTKLYDVTTDVLDDGSVSLVAKIFGSLTPYKKTMTKDEFCENYIIVTNTASDIKKMLKDRKKQDE